MRHLMFMVPAFLGALVAVVPVISSADDLLGPENGLLVLPGGDPVDSLRGGPRYFRGVLGSRNYRDGYFRGSDGYWYPRSTFSTGEMLGDVTVGPGAPIYGMTTEQWCANRYRSYRLTDNTYLPRTGGPRVQCVPQ